MPEGRTEERMHPLSPLVRAWIFVLAGGYALISALAQGNLRWEDIGELGPLLAQTPWWMLGLIAALLVTLGTNYWTWWTTKLVMDDQELRVENTGAFQESKRIAYSRIQSVDINQPLAARLLGLAELSVEVGSEPATKLSFLTRKRATEVRDYLMARAHRQHVTTRDTRREASAWDDTGQGDQVLIRLNPGEIVLGALLSTELPFLLLAFLVPLGISIWLQQPLIALGVGVVPLLLAIGGFLSKRLIGQFNFTLAVTPAGIRITRGLTTLHSHTIPAHRVQSVKISQPLFWRPLKRARLTLTVLGMPSGEDAQDASTIYLPIGNPRQIQTALAALWPDLRLQDLRFRRTPRRARWLSPLSWSWLGYAADSRVVAVRDGWFERQQTIIPHARLQSMQLHQGPFERRLGLASVVALTASQLDRTRIKHLQADQARRLAFGEMDAARAARNQELTSPPPSGAAWQLAAPAHEASEAEADLWTPSTALRPDTVRQTTEAPSPRRSLARLRP
ncbi:PH domain-containing protein [Propioniciclava coleopterorum]|uniref:PH domain-containing protein n=1 Tax=Propioniciclava coleopterorum TaxID=2714937 RepID=A0A6G7Y6Y2_9ACTN|nr:PH domain-containing protein [Propioniciclava coleopterorum]QIK72654.1 PH domain-containing protein [Propioniciclava coleopterorum]